MDEKKPLRETAGPDTRALTADTCHLLVGTSGYSYREWAETGFYPHDTQSAGMLPFYAEFFPITELNFTWYQMPRAEAIERLRQNAPGYFQFAAKLTRTLTHEIEPLQWQKQAALFRDGIAPLIQGRQLTAVLAQMPPTFARTHENRRYLAALFESLDGLPLAIEFRHRSWAVDPVFAELERRKISLALVDGPDLQTLFPSLAIATNPDLFYVRFHGRNKVGWRSGNMQKKFDYNYSEAELHEWVAEKIIPLTATTTRGLIFFNNHVAGQAPRNAGMLIQLLREKGLKVNNGKTTQKHTDVG